METHERIVEYNKSILAVCRLFFVLMDESKMFRRIAFTIALWLQVEATYWSFNFATTHGLDKGLEIAAIIGAVLTPLSAFVAATFKFYSETRSTVDNNIQVDGNQTMTTPEMKN